MHPEPAVSLARRVVGLSIAAVLAVVLATAGATAQTTGTIRGTINDASGNPLPGVVVTASASGVDTAGVTNVDGAFSITGLAAGDYVLTAALFGYASRQLQVTVGAGGIVTVPIILEPAFSLDPLSVVAEEPTVFARNLVAEPMMRQQPSITAVTSVIDNLPGVSVQEGDAYAFDDWADSLRSESRQEIV